MTVRDYIEPAKILFDLVESHKNLGLVPLKNDQDLIQCADFRRLLTHLRQIQNAGEKDKFIQFVEMILAD